MLQSNHYYHQPTKLRKVIFSVVSFCLFTGERGSHVITTWTCSNLFTWGPPGPFPGLHSRSLIIQGPYPENPSYEGINRRTVEIPQGTHILKASHCLKARSHDAFFFCVFAMQKMDYVGVIEGVHTV